MEKKGYIHIDELDGETIHVEHEGDGDTVTRMLTVFCLVWAEEMASDKLTKQEALNTIVERFTKQISRFCKR